MYLNSLLPFYISYIPLLGFALHIDSIMRWAGANMLITVTDSKFVGTGNVICILLSLLHEAFFHRNTSQFYIEAGVRNRLWKGRKNYYNIW